MKVIRIILLILIVLGVGLLVTRAYWVPPLVNGILSHEQAPVVVGVSTTTPATSTKPVARPIPAPAPAPAPAPITSGVDGTVTIGPACPVVYEDGRCGDKPYQTTLVLATTIIGKNG